MRYNFQQASYWWDAGNKSAASDFSQAGKRLKDELQEMYADKEEALNELKAAGERFRQALDVFRVRKAEFEAARDAVTRRYDELKAENERRRKEREAQNQQRERQRQQEAQERERQRQKERQEQQQRKLLEPGPNELDTQATFEEGLPAWREVNSHTPWRSDTFYGGKGYPLGEDHGHIVRINRRIVYRRRPGQKKPDINELGADQL